MWNTLHTEHRKCRTPVLSILQVFFRIVFSKFGSCNPNLVEGILLAGWGANVLQDRVGRGAPYDRLRAVCPMGPTFLLGEV
jgi:hypothetical protein